MIRKKYIIPSPLLRNNFAIPDRGTKRNKEDILIENTYGRIMMRCNGNFSITPTDMKNYIAALNCIYDQLHSFSSKSQRWHYHQTCSNTGFHISFAKLIQYRKIKHHGGIYKSLEKSLQKLHMTNIKLENSYPELRNGKERQKTEQFYLIEKIQIEKTKGDITDRYTIKIKIPHFITECLLNTSNSCIAVNRDTLNNTDGVAFNIYWTILNNSFGQKNNSITFGWDYWINQSNFLHSTSGIRRPREAKDKIRKAFKRLKESGIVLFYKETELKDNRKAILVDTTKISTETESETVLFRKNRNEKTFSEKKQGIKEKIHMEIEATNLEIEATNLEIEATNLEVEATKHYLSTWKTIT